MKLPVDATPEMRRTFQQLLAELMESFVRRQPNTDRTRTIIRVRIEQARNAWVATGEWPDEAARWSVTVKDVYGAIHIGFWTGDGRQVNFHGPNRVYLVEVWNEEYGCWEDPAGHEGSNRFDTERDAVELFRDLVTVNVMRPSVRFRVVLLEEIRTTILGDMRV